MFVGLSVSEKAIPRKCSEISQYKVVNTKKEWNFIKSEICDVKNFLSFSILLSINCLYSMEFYIIY